MIEPKTKYRIVKANYLTLQIEVQELLDNGWVLQGQPFSIGDPLYTEIAQALTMTTEEDAG